MLGSFNKVMAKTQSTWTWPGILHSRLAYPDGSLPSSVFTSTSSFFITSVSPNREVLLGERDLDFDRDGRSLGDFEGLLSRRLRRLLGERVLLRERRLKIKAQEMVSFGRFFKVVAIRVATCPRSQVNMYQVFPCTMQIALLPKLLPALFLKKP
jgi:hypothetical protein